jgi:hypothetical protein
MQKLKSILFVVGFTLTSLLSAAQLTVSWDASTGVPVGYKVERAPGLNATTGFVEVGSVLAPVVSWVDTTVAASTPYSYRVRAYNADAYSGYSNVASTTTRGNGPSIPGNNKVTPPPPLVVLNVGDKMSFANSTNARPNPNDPVQRMRSGEQYLVVAN